MSSKLKKEVFAKLQSSNLEYYTGEPDGMRVDHWLVHDDYKYVASVNRCIDSGTIYVFKITEQVEVDTREELDKWHTRLFELVHAESASQDLPIRE